jgi:ribosomal protein S18 acetylase RimI-like enzyme
MAHLHHTDLQKLSVKEVQMFRDRVLRLGKSEGQSVYRGDDDSKTLHLGAFVDSGLVAIATICHESTPDQPSHTMWRLRGMATLDEFRGRGLGKSLADSCIAHAAKHGGTMVWCKARQSAVGFYRSLGFEEQGNPFPLPKYSDELYFIMQRLIGRE